jgi:hypothetical protein
MHTYARARFVQWLTGPGPHRLPSSPTMNQLGPAPARAPSAVLVPANPLATDAQGGYSGLPGLPRPPVLTPSPALAGPSPEPAPAPVPVPTTPAALPAPPANFTYTYADAASGQGGVGAGAAQFAMTTVTGIADTLSFLLPSARRKARGAADAAVGPGGLPAAGAGGSGGAGVSDVAVPLRVMASKALADHPRTVHPLPGVSAPDNVYMVFNVNRSLLLVDYHGLHRVRSPALRVCFGLCPVLLGLSCVTARECARCVHVWRDGRGGGLY